MKKNIGMPNRNHLKLLKTQIILMRSEYEVKGREIIGGFFSSF